MISEKNTLIGHIVEINGGDFSAQMISEEEGFVSEVTIDGNLVRVGQFVDKGQVIAEVGSTGRTTAPHVHFEVLRNGKPMNPASLLAELKAEEGDG